MPGHAHQHHRAGDAPDGAARTSRSRAPGEHRLIQLQQSAGNAAVNQLLIMRHAVAGTPVHRHTATDLFDPPGTTLSDFVASLTVQADWFAEPTLTAADRADLQALLVRVQEGPHILAGVGDLMVKDLRAVGAADWPALAEYGHGRRNAGDTVRLINAAPRPLADRIALGKTLLDLKTVIPAATLAASVSEAQFLDVHSSALVPALRAYFTTFQPNLEMTYEPTAGARPLEFQNMLDLLRGPGTAPFATLLGRVRNLHRFPPAMLANLVLNFADHSRRRPVHLILHGSHDAAGAFQRSVHLFADLVADPRSLHLMLEGRDTVANITAVVPAIAAAYGQPDATGTPRIGQVMIAGHGEFQQVQLAQNDEMNLDPANPKQRTDTLDLINTLMANMDPATARVVYAGCLVGSSPVPAGTPAAGIGPHLAGHQNLAQVTDQAAVAHGIPAGRTQAARASVALGASSSLMDAAGNMAVQYPFDPTAYGDALTYVATGHEPEGLFRAAVEVAATAGPAVAEAQLRTRLATGVTAGHAWFDEIIVAAITVALQGVALGTGVPAEKLNMLAHMVGPPFLVGNAEDGHGRTVGTLVADVNSQPLAGDLYAHIGIQPSFLAAGDAALRNGRFIIEQAWLAQGGARAASLVGWLDATPTATVGWMGTRLDTGAIAASSGALFSGLPATSGRIRLALAWLRSDPTNADVVAFLTGQVLRPATGPELTPAVIAELDGAAPNEILTDLGVIATAPVAPGGPLLPAANAQVRTGHGNEVRIEPLAYQATVIPAGLNVRRLPGMHGAPFEVVHAGDVLQVAGFVHDWAAVDRNGRLGFVLRTLVTPP
jgi:hypothetical protein